MGPDRCLCVEVPDQGATGAMAAVARALVPMLDGADIVLTHTYEGGHPDHDATAFAVWAATRLLGPDRAPLVLEMPFYRADLAPPHGIVRQSFADREGTTTLHLGEAERRRKGRMLAAHASQAGTLGPFGVADEHVRPAPQTDFTRRPNGGFVLYESFAWRLNGDDFCTQARAARGALGLDPAP